MFIKLNEEYRLVPGKPSDIKLTLDPGVYNIRIVNDGRSSFVHFKEITRYKNTKILDAGVFKRVKTYVENFLADEMFEARKAMNSLDKIGLLFAGDPGTGKTFLAGQICQMLVERKDAIAIMTNTFSDYNLPQLVDTIREANPDKFIVVVLDEFEKCKEYRLEDGELLSYLDGSTSRNNVMNLALVNATSSMKDFLLKRPGRFEVVYDFSEKDDAVLRAMIEGMTPDAYQERIDMDYMAKQLIAEQRRTVDCINIAIRDAIAEIIYFDNHGAFKVFNSFKAGAKQPTKKIGFKSTRKLELDGKTAKEAQEELKESQPTNAIEEATEIMFKEIMAES
jgi:SpoVK/Ycf46/Vps4 family AAA+-type ATPase